MGEEAETSAPHGAECGNSNCDGVLIGWDHHAFAGRIGLRLQSARAVRGGAPDDIRQHHLIMTRNQAVLLAQYLMGVTGQEGFRPKRRGFLARLFRA